MGTLNLERYYNMKIEEVSNWLKSIKPQPHWKPNNKQLEVLIRAILKEREDKQSNTYFARTLESLYNELVKL